MVLHITLTSSSRSSSSHWVLTLALISCGSKPSASANTPQSPSALTNGPHSASTLTPFLFHIVAATLGIARGVAFSRVRNCATCTEIAQRFYKRGVSGGDHKTRLLNTGRSEARFGHRTAAGGHGDDERRGIKRAKDQSLHHSCSFHFQPDGDGGRESSDAIGRYRPASRSRRPIGAYMRTPRLVLNLIARQTKKTPILLVQGFNCSPAEALLVYKVHNIIAFV